MSVYVVALDQGTTSTRAVLFDKAGTVAAEASRPLRQIYPHAGWVEHDPLEIEQAAVAVLREVIEAANGGEIAAIGITNQRETTVVWERETGTPLYNAIVWQDRRTAELCQRLREQGHEPLVSSRSGLLLDPYFSATKVAWLLDEVEGARARAEAGELAFGTIDSWLINRLTGGDVHATDATNASRTMLYDIHRGEWSAELLELFQVPRQLLPEVGDCQQHYGTSHATLIGAALPIYGVAGDQQAAAYGQACFEPGSIKATYGTGCFMLVNTGTAVVPSSQKLISTIAYSLEGQATYALEGSLFMAGATIQWLRDNLGIVESAADSEELARVADPASGVYLVPAFQGLGAPHWDAEARAIITGLSRASGGAEIVRAALEGVAFQTYDLLQAARRDADAVGLPPFSRLRIDGGMAENEWFAQFLSDILDLPVDRALLAEATALGAAFHAGTAAGLYSGQEELASVWKAGARFEPRMGQGERDARLEGWRDALQRSFSSADLAGRIRTAP
jgi:glycerol kinase